MFHDRRPRIGGESTAEDARCNADQEVNLGGGMKRFRPEPRSHGRGDCNHPNVRLNLATIGCLVETLDYFLEIRFVGRGLDAVAGTARRQRKHHRQDLFERLCKIDFIGSDENPSVATVEIGRRGRRKAMGDHLVGFGLMRPF